MAFHSVQHPSGVHHTSPRCALGLEIQYYWIRHGTGGLPRCPRCVELDGAGAPRSLASGPAGTATRDGVRTASDDEVRDRSEVLERLRQLVVALDRGLPRGRRADGPLIERAATDIRAQAVAMIARLEALTV